MKRIFICEKCGKIVPRSLARCSFCGKIFTGVKCPQCGFLGESKLFSEGCPMCGFTGNLYESFVSKKSYNARKSSTFFSQYKKRKKKMFPLGFYRVIGLIVFIMLILLLVIILRYYV